MYSVYKRVLHYVEHIYDKDEKLQISTFQFFVWFSSTSENENFKFDKNIFYNVKELRQE